MGQFRMARGRLRTRHRGPITSDDRAGSRKSLLEVVVVEAVVLVEGLLYPRRHRGHGLGPQVHAATVVPGAEDVLAPRVRFFGEVLAVVGAARLLSEQGAAHDGLRHDQHGAQVEGALEPPTRANRGGAGALESVGPLLEATKALDPLAQPLSGADDAGVVPDEVSQLFYEPLGFLGARGGRERVEGCEVLARGRSVDRHGRQPVETIDQVLAEDLAEDYGLGQGVAPEPVGAVHAGRRLADGVQALDGRGAVARVDFDAAHAVVGGRGDLHGIFGYVYPLLHELLVHVGQPLLDVFGVAVGDVEQHGAVGGATALLNLAVVGARHDVAGV